MNAGRRWAYIGAVLGGVVSIAANIAHSFVPPTVTEGRPPIDPETWSPEPGAVIGAVFWPIALFVAIEILARVAWPAGRRWTALRFLGLLPVALVAAVVSYRHLSGLLAFYGEDSLTVAIGPLAVDGLMLMATGALIATGRPDPDVVEAVSDRSAVSIAPGPLSDPEPVRQGLGESAGESLSESAPDPVSPLVTTVVPALGESAGESASESAPEPVRKAPPKRPVRPDEELLPLLRVVHAAQPLSRSQVMKLTDVSARQASRLLTALTAAPEPVDLPERVNGHHHTKD